MSLTEKQKYDLNNSMSAAQNVSLGDIIDSLGTLSTQDYSNVNITGGTIGSGVTLEGVPGSGSMLLAQTARFGDDTNYSEFGADGTIVFSGSATVWDDIFFPLVTAKQGQTDKPLFSAAELGYLFPQADTTHQMYIVGQFPHSYKIGSDLSPHVHWKQTQSGSVVFKLDYKWFPIGGTVPNNWSTYIMANHAIPYTSGSIHQLSYGPKISGSILETTTNGVSSIMLMKLYRDDNTYAGTAVTYQMDIHFQKDSLGSHTEFTK